MSINEIRNDFDALRASVSSLMNHSTVLTAQITQFNATLLETAADQATKLQTDAAELAERISDYISAKPFSSIQLLPLAIQTKGLIGDIGALAKTIPATIDANGKAMAKVGKLDRVKSAHATGAPTAEPEATHDPTEPPAPIHSLEGQWREVGADNMPVILFLGPVMTGKSLGMVAAAAHKIQAFLELHESTDKQTVYRDKTSGNLFGIAPFEDQIILKHYQADGTRIFQIFMERP